MRKPSPTVARAIFATIAIIYVLTHFFGHAHAQSSLGIGTNEATLPSTGLFAGFLNWVNTQQQDFYRALTGAMRAIRDGEGGGAWLLAGLSFAYGVFHAAGPGHGKAVISSYMLANEVALRRGVAISFLSAFAQAVTAILVMGTVFLFLRGTSVSMTDATRFLEVASYGLVTGLGAWLLWKKAGGFLLAAFSGRPARGLSAAASAEGVGQRHDHHHKHDHSHDHDHSGEVCATCGHAHAPDPVLVSGDRFEWRSALSAVAAVGLRPCSGALIVLTFAFLNGLWVAGIASVFAMALGTAITVSVLATIAVTAKGLAVRLASNGRTGNRIHQMVEIAGAAFIFLIGLTLLAASL
ncbi:MAG: nickel/cobalt transporter [Rhizobiaceae bacterium]|nr:nickel/cobalt transporter [Rhizobiaceae bacterium]MCV0406955.1 nickel/cobalt transporter [Rhizobiaceae bacterium]